MWGQLQEPGRVKQIDRLEESDTLCRFQRAAFDILNKKDCPSSVQIATTKPLAVHTSGCGGMIRCLDNKQCAQCITSINATSGFHTVAQYNSISHQDSTRSESCCVFPNDAVDTCPIFFFLKNATPPEITQPALQELAGVPALCYETYVMAISPCIQYELYCTSPT